jgi:deoxycytidylate deaminase
MEKYFKYAIKEIENTDFDERLRSHVCALITKGGSILSIATNTINPDPYSLKYTHNEYLNSTHAEVNAILQIRHKIDLTGTKMWVARLTKPDLTETCPKVPEIAMTAPCKTCKKIIKMHGIYRVYYTIDANTTGYWKVNS